MKRTLLVAALLLGSVASSYADTSIYNNVRKGGTDDQLQAAGNYCDQRLGPVQNGAITSARYKKCMLSQDWRYQRTKREQPSREHTWIDPDTGDTCHDILGGLGSSCGNF